MTICLSQRNHDSVGVKWLSPLFCRWENWGTAQWDCIGSKWRGQGLPVPKSPLTSLHAACLNCMVARMEEGDIQGGEVMDRKSYFKFPLPISHPKALCRFQWETLLWIAIDSSYQLAEFKAFLKILLWSSKWFSIAMLPSTFFKAPWYRGSLTRAQWSWHWHLLSS